MIELGWMGVALVAILLAWHRVGQMSSKQLVLPAHLAAYPAPEVFLGGLDELSVRMKKLEDGGMSVTAVVARANDLTKDMLAMKTILAELREQVSLLRTKNSLRAVGGSAE